VKIPSKKFTDSFSLPVYGLGTWQMGGRGEADTSRDSQEIAAIREAINHGVTHIDTAEVYGVGHSEELVGQAIAGFDRSKLFIATKVSAPNQGYSDLKASCYASLKRLGVGYVDLYLLHRYPSKGLPIADTMKAMDELVEEGKVKNIGVCNFTVPMLEEAKKHTKNSIVCNQVHYNLACREIVDKGILSYCVNNNIAVVAWGPLEKGMLAKEGLLRRIADKYQKTPFQIALNWLTSQDGVVTIPKTSQVKHLEENLGAIGWALDESDMKDLTDNFPDQYLVSERVPLNYATDLGESNSNGN